MTLIESIIDFPKLKPDPLPFKLDNSRESLDFNKKSVKKINLDLDKLIPSFKNNLISLGIDFRDPITLEPLVHSYKYWHMFKDICNNRFSCQFLDASEE